MIKPDPKAALLPNSIDARQKLLGRHRSVISFTGSQAIITSAAILIRERLAKILQQRNTAAGGNLRVMGDLLQLLARDSLLLRVGLFLNELRVLHHISRAKKQQAIARQTVAPGPARLLVIALDILRQIVMHDEAHIRLVDPHAKSH